LRDLARSNSIDHFSTAVDEIAKHLHEDNFVGIEELPNPVMQ
jgi:hypothetical protein